jgi:hypothetical protein
VGDVRLPARPDAIGQVALAAFPNTTAVISSFSLQSLTQVSSAPSSSAPSTPDTRSSERN